MAELPPPPLLLGRRQAREHRPGERGASSGAPDDQRPDPSARGGPRREAVHAEGTEPRADRCRPRGVPLCRRDLRSRPGVHGSHEGRDHGAADAPGGRRLGRAGEVHRAPDPGARVPPRKRGARHLSGEPLDGGLHGRPGHARGRRRPGGRTGRTGNSGPSVQPSPRRVRPDVLRGARGRPAVPAPVSPLARRGSLPRSRRRFDAPSSLERVVRRPRHPAQDHRGAG